MNKKKTIINLLFLLTVFSLTMYLVFHGKDVNEILSAARTADKGYLFLSLICVVLFILGESVIIYYMMKSLGGKGKNRSLRPIFLCWIFLQLYYTFCYRRTAYADLLYEKG